MEHKEKVIEAIKILALRLQGHTIKWLIGGSGSLLVHGLDIIPNDIDLVVDPRDYEEAKIILKDLLTETTKPDGNILKTHFIVDGISGDLLTHNIDNKLLTIVNIDGVDISVHQLKVEYNYYKTRTDKILANKKKIELIEQALEGINDS